MHGYREYVYLCAIMAKPPVLLLLPCMHHTQADECQKRIPSYRQTANSEPPSIASRGLSSAPLSLAHMESCICMEAWKQHGTGMYIVSHKIYASLEVQPHGCVIISLIGQACNIAFAKTHKTASTTMAMILVRYARRHDKEVRCNIDRDTTRDRV